jgi:hypothetical protein
LIGTESGHRYWLLEDFSRPAKSLATKAFRHRLTCPLLARPPNSVGRIPFLAQPSLLDHMVEATDANMVRGSLPEENDSTEGSFRRWTHASRSYGQWSFRVTRRRVCATGSNLRRGVTEANPWIRTPRPYPAVDNQSRRIATTCSLCSKRSSIEAVSLVLPAKGQSHIT